MKTCFTLLLISTASFATIAQSEDAIGEFWLAGQMALATEKFAEDIDTPWGGGFELGYVHNLSPNSNVFQLGGQLGYTYLGKDKTEILFIPVKTTNSLITLHLVSRIRPPSTGNIHPYIDLMLGGKFFTTVTKYDNSALETLLDVEDETIFNDQTIAAWSYGPAVGLSGRKDFVGFDFKLAYLKGPAADYTSPRDFVVESDGSFYYERTKVGSTDMIFINIGFSVLLE